MTDPPNRPFEGLPPERTGQTGSGVALGLIASVAAPFLSFRVFGGTDSPILAIFGIPVLVLVLGIVLAKWGNRAMWMPFLISFAIGFIVFAGVCAALVYSFTNAIHPE